MRCSEVRARRNVKKEYFLKIPLATSFETRTFTATADEFVELMLKLASDFVASFDHGGNRTVLLDEYSAEGSRCWETVKNPNRSIKNESFEMPFGARAG